MELYSPHNHGGCDDRCFHIPWTTCCKFSLMCLVSDSTLAIYWHFSDTIGPWLMWKARRCAYAEDNGSWKVLYDGKLFRRLPSRLGLFQTNFCIGFHLNKHRGIRVGSCMAWSSVPLQSRAVGYGCCWGSPIKFFHQISLYNLKSNKSCFMWSYHAHVPVFFFHVLYQR